MHPAIEEKFARLLETLSYNTQVDQIEWEQAFDDASFTARIGTQTIELAARDSDGQAPFLIKVYQKGELRDTFTSNEFQYQEDDLYNLYELVARKIRGADKVLDELLSALPSVPPKPKSKQEEPPF